MVIRPTMITKPAPKPLDLLILGAGWTSTFLIPLLSSLNLTFAATTRDGHTVANHDTIKWSFDPTQTLAAAKDKKTSQFSTLPQAKHVLITFPLTGSSQSRMVIEGYEEVFNKKRGEIGFIQLGSTGIWQISQKDVWVTRHSPHNLSNPRAIAEDQLLGLGGCVLNLSGLWGGSRDPKTWVSRVAKTKEDVRGKGSLHMIHGVDVARAIVAIVKCNWRVHGAGERWMLTDGFVYDWWALFAGWADVNEEGEGEGSDLGRWVYELMGEEGVRALPRSMEVLGRAYDSREFWRTFGIAPLKARI